VLEDYGNKKSKFLKKIFSCVNSDNKIHKVITILGIKFKVRKQKGFVCHKIRKNHVLLVELNKCHGECLPGMAEYFLKLGYYVDVLMNSNEAFLEPFSDFKNKRLALYSEEQQVIKEILSSDFIKNYKYVYFNSANVFSKPVITISEYLEGKLKYPKEKVIVMSHDSSSYDKILFNSEKLEIVSLLDLAGYDGKRYKAVNTHYFKEIKSHKKNEVTRFIVIGNIQSSRKNHSNLIDTVSKLVANNITNFKIIVVARSGKIDIPEALQKFFEFKGKLSYGQMYKELEQSDFFLTLFDPENAEHDRYLYSGASGSYQLIYGVNLPCLIPHKFQAKVNGFNNFNSVGYKDNSDLITAMKSAIDMTEDEYVVYKKNLKVLEEQIYNKSLENLKELLKSK
jgi:hypothetical protein